MASSPGVVTDENYLNLFTFSHCSISEITKHLTFLNMMGRNCLVNSVPNHYNSALITHHLQTPPGQIFTIDQQCQYIHQSVSSYYCGGANNDRDICRVMECYHPDYKRCYSSVEQRAANGTSCGHKKWCMMGDCLDDQRAPAFLDYCWSGDYKGTFYDGRTCNKVVQDSPWMCYDEKYRDACCKRCEDIVDKNNQDCPYGDKNEWCEDISRRDCYTKQVKDVCCRSCARFLTGIEGCDYGDRAGWCSTVTPGSCYANEHTCCAKCASFAIQSRNDASCLYGDKAGWCSTVTAEQCYSVHSTCCNSCKRFKTQIPGCEFGNFGTHCGSRDCNDPYWANRCCATCSAYIQPPTTRVPKTSTEPTSQKPSTTARVSTTLRYNQTSTPSTTSSTTTSVPYIPPANIQCSMDKADWCQALPKNRCYLDNDVCCNTCPKHYTGIEGCEFGDHASWCDFIFPGSCYDPTYMKQCCKTCPTLIDLTAAIDCMYGDRYTWCEEILPSDCEDPKKRYECCKKCNSATTTTTTTTLSPSTDSPTPSTSRVTTSQQTTSTTRKHITSRTTTSAVVPTGILYPDCNFNSDASWCSSIPSSYCYSVEKSCCQKCSTFWKNNPGCEYGDHFTWCRRIDPTQCNDIYYKSECCSTCNQYIDSTTTVTLPPACVDTMNMCSTMHVGECYTVAELCCHTCVIAQTNIEGCKYGDHYPSCESLTRRECYFKSYRDSCCSTCAMLKSNDPTCPWGDRYTDCSGADCTKLQVREYCCETCGVIPDVKEETTSSLSPISPECKDNATWCPNIPARDCYVSDHTCCRTCVEFYTGLPNCIYGDETSWCANVVFTVEDCANIRIGPYCCMTCFMITLRSGYELPPEPDIETNEGVLLILGDTSIDETLSKEPGLLDMLSLYLDEFCMASVKKCCEMAKLKKRQPLPPYGERRFRYFQKTHGHIGQGYPRNAYSGNIITKILMKFPTEFMDTMCYDPTKLWKRDVSRPSQIRFVEKYLLYSILIENELVIEQALDMKIVRVLSVDEANALSHTSTSSRDKVALAVGITALFGILFLVIILIVVVCSKKKKSRVSKGNTKNVKSSADQQQPNAYTWVHEKHIHERKLRVVGDNESVSFDNIENSFQQDTMLKKKRNDTILDEGFENIAYTSMHRPDLLT